MLQDEFDRLAMSVDYLSDDQFDQICGTVLERFKQGAGAVIVDIWVRNQGRHGIDTLTRMFHLDEGSRRNDPLTIALAPEARSLLAWVAESDKALLIEDLPEGAAAARNSLGGEVIEQHFVDVDPRTRSFAAIPIKYRSQRAILSIEAGYRNCLKEIHVRHMRELEGAIGILIWKTSVFRENQSQTSKAIQAFARANSERFGSVCPYKSGFIARPFDPQFDALDTAIKDGLRKEKVHARAYKHPPGSGLIMDQMLQQIREAHFGIVDASELNHNVLVEFGIMLGLGKPMVIFTREGSIGKLPFDVTGYQCYEYVASGPSIAVRHGSSAVPIHDILRSFKENRLANDKGFREAKDWNGEEF